MIRFRKVFSINVMGISSYGGCSEGEVVEMVFIFFLVFGVLGFRYGFRFS